MITAKHGLRSARAICACDEPGCHEVADLACPLESIRTFKSVPASVERKPDLPKAHKKLTNMGWRVDRGKIFCPSHSKSPKATKEKPMANMILNTPAMPKVDDSLRKPTREQKRAIMEMLGVCYDTKSSRYTGDETDVSVAKALGDGILFGWVADIREEFFGPIGSNAAIDELHADISAAITSGLEVIEGLNAIKDKAAGLVEDLNRRVAKATSTIGDMRSLRDRLDRITAKLGPKA